ncbi:hypothetical protein [Leuconostoc gasicomitatum]|uniref:hypothetical protein n=1 Tax=Leuconostoc gasicomitatum TaxID=115778 RepID=UPI001CC3EEEB|nr:hypothetical protein [Leuconostoc gasicomitatum]MBZ5998636.1 hypothetical protein [Leuconostoc gasicomitatum]
MRQEREQVYDLYSPLSYRNVLYNTYISMGLMVVCAIMFSIFVENVYFVFSRHHFTAQAYVMVGVIFWAFLVVIFYKAIDYYNRQLSAKNALLSEVLNVGFNQSLARKLSDSIASKLNLSISDQVSVLPYRDPDIMLRIGYAGSFRQLIVMTKDDDYLVMYNSNYQVVRFRKIKEEL